MLLSCDAAAMAMSTVCVPAMAADDMSEPNPVIKEHPDDTMSPTAIVTPIGKHMEKIYSSAGIGL